MRYIQLAIAADVRRGTGQLRLTSHSLVELAEAMLDEIAPHLPTACRV